MSSDLYSMQVAFEGHQGCIKAPGVYRSISCAPTIPGLPTLEAIDFVPEVNRAQLKPRMSFTRAMSELEALAVVAWLRTVQAGTDGGTKQ